MKLPTAEDLLNKMFSSDRSFTTWADMIRADRNAVLEAAAKELEPDEGWRDDSKHHSTVLRTLKAAACVLRKLKETQEEDHMKELSDQPSIFERELRDLINRNSMENGCNTPDFILANFLVKCLEAFNFSVNHRADWYGAHSEPGKAAELRGEKL
ncbi:MAG: hypothetical protein V3R16_02595 [Nitrospirales bacterium]